MDDEHYMPEYRNCGLLPAAMTGGNARGGDAVSDDKEQSIPSRGPVLTTHDRHMQLIDAVNDATTPVAKREARARLEGWRDGVRYGGGFVDLIAADLEQFDRGHKDRPMCCGVFLD
jgi:hypothetical protein